MSEPLCEGSDVWCVIHKSKQPSEIRLGKLLCKVNHPAAAHEYYVGVKGKVERFTADRLFADITGIRKYVDEHKGWKSEPTVYSVDFDGTLVTDRFPDIGEINMRGVQFLMNVIFRGDKWILNTMREGKLLDEAVEFLKRQGFTPDAVNDNIDFMKATYKNNPRKIYADVYIDDHNAGGLQWPK